MFILQRRYIPRTGKGQEVEPPTDKVKVTEAGEASPPSVTFTLSSDVPWPLQALAGADAVGRILAIDPRAGQLLILRRVEQAAGVAGLPVLDLVGLAALLTALLPARRPGVVGWPRLTSLAVPEQDPAFAVRLHAQGHRGEGGGAE